MLSVCIMKASSHIINFDSFNNYPIILLLLSANLCHQRLINESTIHADYRHKKSLQILLSLSIIDILLAAIPAESGSAGTSTNPAKCFHPNLFPTCSVWIFWRMWIYSSRNLNMSTRWNRRLPLGCNPFAPCHYAIIITRGETTHQRSHSTYYSWCCRQNHSRTIIIFNSRYYCKPNSVLQSNICLYQVSKYDFRVTRDI